MFCPECGGCVTWRKWYRRGRFFLLLHLITTFVVVWHPYSLWLWISLLFCAVGVACLIRAKIEYKRAGCFV